jgi:hypothetical protein
MPRGLPKALLGAGVAALLAALPAMAAAGRPAAVTIASPAAGHVDVGGGQGLTAGVTQITFTTRRKDATLALFELKPGVTPEQLAAALAQASGPRDVRDLAALRYAPEIGRGQDATAYLDLRAGTYVAADVSGGSVPPAQQTIAIAAHPAGAPVARSPRATGHIGLRDFRFVAPARIAPRGVLRYANTGRTFHYADAIRLGAHASFAKALTALRAGRSTVPGSTGFAPLIGLVGPGQTGEAPYRLARGRYVLVSFYADADSHDRPQTRLGMERALVVG